MSCINLEHLKVLHVDANERGHLTVRTIFGAMQIRQLSHLTDASLIFQQIDQFNPDILLSEYFTAPFNGIDLIRKVRQDKDSPNPHIPIILLTAQTDRSVVMGARDAGANYTLAMPVSIAQMYKSICWLVESPMTFVRTGRFFGPDRRRKVRPFDGDERRSSEEEGEAATAEAPSRRRPEAGGAKEGEGAKADESNREAIAGAA